MTQTPSLDHIALTVPDLDSQVERLQNAFGMVVQSRSDRYALVSDLASGFKIELSRSEDSEVHFRHLGFRAEDVNESHEALLGAGMETSEAPIAAISPACTHRSSKTPAASKSNLLSTIDAWRTRIGACQEELHTHLTAP